MAVKNWTGTNQVLINLEGHGREAIIPDSDVSRTIGWFTSLYPVILNMAKSGDLGYQIKAVKEMFRRIPVKGVGYGILKYLTPETERDGLIFKLQPEISFNYLGQFDQDLPTTLFTISDIPAGQTISPDAVRPYKLDISGLVISGQLNFNFVYNQHEYRENTMSNFTSDFKRQLLLIIEHCSTRQGSELTPSDLGDKSLSLEELGEIEDLFNNL